MMRPAAELNQASYEVHAVLEAGSLSRPPLVSLSFQGLAEPTSLFTDLESLGWVIPSRPPRPASAIDWSTPDENGNAFTVRGYRVDDFRPQPGVWPTATRSRIGALTVAVLQRHKVTIHADEAYLRLLFPAQADADEAEVLDLRLPADPLPDTIIIERATDSMAGLCDYRVFSAQARVTSELLVWAERARQVAHTELRAQRTVVDNSVHAWRVVDGDAPDTPTTSERSLRIVVPDARAALDLVTALRSMMGDRVGTLSLAPMDGAPNTTRSGLLIVGLVEASKIDRVRELLLQRYPSIIIRI